MEAARSVCRAPENHISAALALAAPCEPTSFAGSVKQHMAEGGGFEPPEGISFNGFQDRRDQLLCHPSVLVEPAGIEPASPPCKDGALPAELWPQIQAVWSDDRLGCHRGKYRMTRWENHGRSGGDRTRGPLLPKQVRCRCATLRCCYLALLRIALPGTAPQGYALPNKA